MVLWCLCGLRVLCCGGVVGLMLWWCGLGVLWSLCVIQWFQSYLCGVCVIQSNNNNFYFYLLFSGSSVLSLGSQCSQGLMLWWSYLCGGVVVWWWVLLITGLNNRCGVSGNSVFGFYVGGVEMA